MSQNGEGDRDPMLVRFAMALAAAIAFFRVAMGQDPARRLAVTRDMRRLLPVVGVVAAGVGIHGTSGQSQQSRSLRTSDTNLALSPEILLSTQTPLQGLFRDCRQLEIQAILSMCLKPAS